MNNFHHKRGKPLVWSLCLFLVFYGFMFWQSLEWLVPSFIYPIKSPCFFGWLMISRAYFWVLKKQLNLLLFLGAQKCSTNVSRWQGHSFSFAHWGAAQKTLLISKKKKWGNSQQQKQHTKTWSGTRLGCLLQQRESKYGSTSSLFRVSDETDGERDTTVFLKCNVF